VRGGSLTRYHDVDRSSLLASALKGGRLCIGSSQRRPRRRVAIQAHVRPATSTSQQHHTRENERDNEGRTRR
jgi:hypothetical protein